MKTITIIEGVTLTATQSTIDAYLAEVAKAEAERLAGEGGSLSFGLAAAERSGEFFRQYKHSRIFNTKFTC